MHYEISISVCKSDFKRMNRYLLTILISIQFFNIFGQAPQIIPGNWPSIKGLWKFDNPNNLTYADFGSSLILTGTQTSIPGPQAGDLAVSIGVGSYYKCFHNIAANGGGTEVNEYSMVYDFRAPIITPWYCFYQTNATNSNDGELFINPSGKIGRATNGPGYADYSVIAGDWYRLVVTCDLGNQYKIYLDGVLIRQGGPLTIDGDFSLYPLSGNNFFYFFADNDDEDAPIDIALCSIFEGALTPTQVASLGGYEHEIPALLTGILPYLQTPTPTSVYINWHSDSISSTIVQYGTTQALGNTIGGTYEAIGIKKWHNVKLVGLSPNTEYFYKCISGSDESPTFSFRTPPIVAAGDQHLRFLIFGDNQSDVIASSNVASGAKLKLQEMYGYDLQNHINLILHLGDIVGDGTNNSAYEDEYFKPFSCLSANIPSMVTIGNHEADNSFYYQYMKYEDLDGAASPYSERYYTFKILDARFIAINSNPAQQTVLQQNWFQNKLIQSESDASTDFNFVYAHHPAHSEIWPDGNILWTQTQVFDKMKNYSKSALYACGHTHAYEHSIQSTTTDSTDFQALINGGGGGPLDRWGMYTNQTDYPEVFRSLDHYCFNLIDIDVPNHCYTGYTYSLGNPGHPMNCVLVDVFHRKIGQAAPQQPASISPIGATMLPITLSASSFAGIDSLFSSQFQVTTTPGNFQTPSIDVKRDKENWYGDSGPPGYLSINLNNSIDLQHFEIITPLILGQTYSWRMRYRDYNLRWSEWSGERTFTCVNGYVISGFTEYDNIQASLLGQVFVQLIKNDTVIDQITTGINGSFVFPAVLPGNYSIQCSSSQNWGGVNSLDALLILKHFVGINILTGIKLKAADLDGNTHVNSVDALFAAKRFAGSINSFPSGDWVFEHPQINITGNNSIHIKGLCTGDVNGSFLP